MKPIKILLLSSKYQPEYSGSGLRAHLTYKRLKTKMPLDYQVVCSSLEHRGVCQYQHQGINVLRIAGLFKVFNFHGYLRRMIVWLNMPFEVFVAWFWARKRVNDFDLLHSFGDSWTVGFLTWYFAGHNKAIMRELCNEVSTPFYPKPWQKWIAPVFKKNNAMMVAISPMLESLAVQYGARHIWQRPNPIRGIFRPSLSMQKYQLRQQLTKFEQNDIVICHIGVFWANKNQLFLLKLLSQLDVSYKLLLVGSIKKQRYVYYQKMLKKIKDNGLSDRVQIIDQFIDNPQDYMALSDVYVMPSKHEGLGTPILEAQACAVPVVANVLPGVTDCWIEERKSGYVRILDEKEWLIAIKAAVDIDKNSLINNADNILKKAGESVIDSAYIKKIRELINE